MRRRKVGNNDDAGSPKGNDDRAESTKVIGALEEIAVEEGNENESAKRVCCS